ncbi:MAG TPA: SoxR reducing system RseC family protein [Candidatus Cloacimonas sp.]|jgi:positive regulator of sigma E activity|nr:SoxR reducing system RseC family protein [Candidatus Cloacimonas sp.]MDD2250723.1 SoxR reducing system RseC family protein [Candidatus Cloacimonadota bacterium]MCK9157432.1 SoxR reducing system RseC family protein [Candidatus Cloacimonas sp.]MCK9165012.1 SoxR reducing system RseC family protein [Candidatus Cloacimonas sp.]MDD3733517.1 SoxR reducing system RseC family protein [Candidatus Cloacimonadota bacterium]
MNAEIIEDSGIVTKVEGNCVTVEIKPGGGCKSCTMRGFCFKESEPTKFEIITDLPLQVNDRVQLDISPVGRTLVSLLVFGVPIIFLFLGFIIASLWFIEFVSILIGFVAMGLSFRIVRLIDKKYGKRLKISVARKL